MMRVIQVPSYRLSGEATGEFLLRTQLRWHQEEFYFHICRAVLAGI